MTTPDSTAQSAFGMPRIGDPAPEFTAVTTQGPIDFPADYRGKWVIFFSHPADFTPVCTSEFITFASMSDQFKQYNTELVGLSIDGLYSHIAWLRTIKDKISFNGMSEVEVTFPLVEDITMEIARLYGMIMPGESSSKAVRAVFVIDPSGVVRAVIYYPLSTGRNFDELLRLVKALQTADAFDVATPADWRPGDPVIVPPRGLVRHRSRPDAKHRHRRRMPGLVLLHPIHQRVRDRGRDPSRVTACPISGESVVGAAL